MPEQDTHALMDSYRASRPRLVEWVKTHYIDEFRLKPCKMIDLCAGDGFWADIFAELGFPIPLAVEINPALVNIGIDRYFPAIDLYAGAVEDLHPAIYGGNCVEDGTPIRIGPPIELVFMRGIPHFYREPNLTTLRSLLTPIIRAIDRDALILLSAYTDGSGELRDDFFWHHEPSTFTRAIRLAGGTIVHTARQGNYLQIGARR